MPTTSSFWVRDSVHGSALLMVTCEGIVTAVSPKPVVDVLTNDKWRTIKEVYVKNRSSATVGIRLLDGTKRYFELFQTAELEYFFEAITCYHPVVEGTKRSWLVGRRTMILVHRTPACLVEASVQLQRQLQEDRQQPALLPLQPPVKLPIETVAAHVTCSMPIPPPPPPPPMDYVKEPAPATQLAFLDELKGKFQHGDKPGLKDSKAIPKVSKQPAQAVPQLAFLDELKSTLRQRAEEPVGQKEWKSPPKRTREPVAQPFVDELKEKVRERAEKLSGEKGRKHPMESVKSPSPVNLLNLDALSSSLKIRRSKKQSMKSVLRQRSQTETTPDTDLSLVVEQLDSSLKTRRSKVRSMKSILRERAQNQGQLEPESEVEQEDESPPPFEFPTHSSSEPIVEEEDDDDYDWPSVPEVEFLEVHSSPSEPVVVEKEEEEDWPTPPKFEPQECASEWRPQNLKNQSDALSTSELKSVEWFTENEGSLLSTLAAKGSVELHVRGKARKIRRVRRPTRENVSLLPDKTDPERASPAKAEYKLDVGTNVLIGGTRVTADRRMFCGCCDWSQVKTRDGKRTCITIVDDLLHNLPQAELLRQLKPSGQFCMSHVTLVKNDTIVCQCKECKKSNLD